jgi:hypothetical protein
VQVGAIGNCVADAMLLDRRVYQDAAQRSQTCKCPRVIQPDQSAVTDHIGVEHDDQLPPIRRPASRSEALVTDIA